MRLAAKYVLRLTITGAALALVGADSVPSETPDCSTDAVRAFHGKLQAVLQNTCMNCHVAEKSAFPLRRGDTMANLTAALKQVDRKQPSASPLLQKAIVAHGGMTRPPIKDANAPAYKHLESWVKLVANPQPMAAPAKPGSLAPEPTAGLHDAQGWTPRDPFDPEIFNRSR